MFKDRDECKYCSYNTIKIDNATNKMLLLEQENKNLREIYIELKNSYNANILQLSKMIEELNNLRIEKDKYTKTYNKLFEYAKWHPYLEEVPDFSIHCRFYEICGKNNEITITRQLFKDEHEWYRYMTTYFPRDYIAYWRAIPLLYMEDLNVYK